MKKIAVDPHGHGTKKNVSVWFEPRDIDRLTRLAVRGDISRSVLIGNLALVGADYLEVCEKFGVLQTALVLRDLGYWLKEKLEKDTCLDGVPEK
jgi:hypothetical protein